MRCDAILPAGGRIAGPLAEETGTSLKALLPIGGRSVLEWTVSALRATGRVDRILVVGPEEVRRRAETLADVVLPETRTGAGNILRGLRGLGTDPADPRARALIVTTDLPFLTPAAVCAFLESCPGDREVCVPVLERHEFETRFARGRTRYVHLRDGAWMIGCAFLVSPAALLRKQALVEGVFASRRSQLAMARLLGWRFLLRLAARRVRLSDVERQCLSVLGCSGAAIRGCPPELGFDIDYPADYHYAVLRWARA